MTTLRQMVIQSFKKLHRTRLKVFAGDERTLLAGRKKINEEYQKNKHVTDIGAIKELVKYAEAVDKELRTQVIQAKEVKPGVFEARITEDTAMLDNIPYNNNAVPEDKPSGSKPCCQKK